ncbi:AF4/FMR2 family member lilli-like isoform X2 [Uranotaenia lowii]|uniref:AF4/FMR2 family member lilli-like isoform X2 n=1 Tax=Uranotaenia lowii TaxID=190385 RepID=UPI002478978E|nr:AF4/FMR2 family member lilli-like isoform X2 [Uranotaenia lowii]
MSTSRYLNWSRPSPGRHPLRKQMSCFESFSGSGNGRSLSARRGSSGGSGTATPTSTTSTHMGGGSALTRRRPASASVSSSYGRSTRTQPLHGEMPKKVTADGPRKVSLSKQFSLDRPAAGHAWTTTAPVSNSSRMTAAGGTALAGSGSARATISTRTTDNDDDIQIIDDFLGGYGDRNNYSSSSGAGNGNGFAPFDRRIMAPPHAVEGHGKKNHAKPSDQGEKPLNQGKDSRINIKIFLGQSVTQQDSSDNGISDTECSTTATTTTTAQRQQTARTNTSDNTTNRQHHQQNEQQQQQRNHGPYQAQQQIHQYNQQQQQQQQGNQKAETENSEGDNKPIAKLAGSTTSSQATPGTLNSGSSASSSTPSSSSTSSAGSTTPAAAPTSGSTQSGRSSSLAQRRAQFHANRQYTLTTSDRRPPLVRAMSAPIRPVDDNSKFLQSSKKKLRKKRALRERDELYECDEDDFDEDTLRNNAVNNGNGKNHPAALPPGSRARSVLGTTTTTTTACDIETLVSLLSSGGSDSEKEDTVPPDLDGPNAIGTSALKCKAPMLKKSGKSVSFQESDLKPPVSLNRDYYPTGQHRKPPSLQPIANRIRRSQQLANTLSAFQRKEIKKSPSEESKSDEDKDHPSSGSDDPIPKEKSSTTSTPSNNSTTTTKPSNGSSTVSGQQKQQQNGSTDLSTTTTGDGQTPKERECYRLFQKMATKGLSVSYDTILRGMLTPTELRVLQKQRSKLEKQQESSRQNSSETENNGSNSDSNSSNNNNITNNISDRSDTRPINVSTIELSGPPIGMTIPVSVPVSVEQQ